MLSFWKASFAVPMHFKISNPLYLLSFYPVGALASNERWRKCCVNLPNKKSRIIKKSAFGFSSFTWLRTTISVILGIIRISQSVWKAVPADTVYFGVPFPLLLIILFLSNTDFMTYGARLPQNVNIIFQYKQTFSISRNF